MTKHHHPGLRSVHRALADPMRIRLLECLWGRPQSGQELAAWAGIAPDRLYRPAPMEPPDDEATPREYAELLGAMLEAPRADITAASMAKEAGERREITLLRATVRLSEADLVTLRERLLELVRLVQEQPDDEGIWTRVVVTLVDLQDRGQPSNRGDPA